MLWPPPENMGPSKRKCLLSVLAKCLHSAAFSPVFIVAALKTRHHWKGLIELNLSPSIFFWRGPKAETSNRKLCSIVCCYARNRTCLLCLLMLCRVSNLSALLIIMPVIEPFCVVGCCHVDNRTCPRCLWLLCRG